jgi:hypothetical protein
MVVAQQAGYKIVEYEAIGPPMIDGTFTVGEEWYDAQARQLDGDLDAEFRIKYNSELITGDIIYHYFLIEVVSDTTNDPGDYARICFAAANEEGGTPMGGTAPQTDCTRFDWVGPGESGLTFYRGDGTAWVESTEYTWGIDVQIAESYSASPSSSTPHWIIEGKIEAEKFKLYPDMWIRVATYDDSNAAAGEQSWPAGHVDVPNDWGEVTFESGTIPEFSSWIILPMLVTAALVILVARKRLQKTKHDL